jgi:hypothetical protein
MKDSKLEKILKFGMGLPIGICVCAARLSRLIPLFNYVAFAALVWLIGGAIVAGIALIRSAFREP